jgi:hypothetical protein
MTAITGHEVRAMAKPKAQSPITGSWHIVSMSAWEDEYLNEEVQAYIEFDEHGSGSFQFGYIQGRTDCRTTKRDGKPAVEFSWEGGDGADGTPLTGRGSAVIEGDELNGTICIHMGDDSDFTARRVTTKKATKRK